MRRTLIVLAPSILLFSLAAATARAAAEDPEHPRGATYTAEDVRRWSAVDPRALVYPDPHVREVAARIAAGTTDVRLLREWYRIERELAPFEAPPPTTAARLAAVARWRELAARSAPSALPVNGQWLPLGPRNIPGRSTCIALHPTDPATAYVGTADGGVWRTTDGGERWLPLGDREATLAIGAIAIDPVDPQIIYAGTGEGNYGFSGLGLLKSTDGGSSWVLHTNGTPGRFHSLAIDPADRTHLLAGAPNGLFVSNDSGVSFSLVGGGLPRGATHKVLFSKQAPGLVFAAVRLASQNGIYRSLDGGASWSYVTPGFPVQIDRVVLAEGGAGPYRVWAAVADASSPDILIYRSDDQGASFQAMSASPGQICSSYCWYCLEIAADPASIDLVYVAGVNFARSSDGGQSFSPAANHKPNALVHVDHHGLVAPRPDELWTANDGGVHVSLDRGENWRNAGGGLETAQFYHLATDPVDDGWALGGTQDQGTPQFSGNGDWRMVVGSDGAYSAIHPVDPSIVFASSQYLALFRSRDRGRSFRAIGNGINPSEPRAFIAPIALDRSDPDALFAGTNRLYRSADQGTSFVPISPSLGVIRAIDNCRDAGSVIWVTTDSGVWHTANGGLNWDNRRAGLPAGIETSVSVHPSDPATAYVSLIQTSGTPGLWKTTNSGQSWTGVASGLPDVGFNCVLVLEDAPETVVAAASLGVYISTDGGSSWNVLGTGLPNVVVEWLAYSRASGTLRAGTFGRGAWQLSLPTPCLLPPDFAGLAAVSSGVASGCVPRLEWGPGNSNCPSAPGIRYAVYRSTDASFVPGPASLVAAGLTARSYVDAGAPAGVVLHYLVKAEDGQAGFEGPANGGRLDLNLVRRAVMAGEPWATSGTLRDDGGDTMIGLASDFWVLGRDGNTTPGGQLAWVSSPLGTPAYPNYVCAAISTPDLTLGPSATLSYAASFNLEDTRDGVVVEISTDGGATWSDLPPDAGYPGLLTDDIWSACTFALGRPAFAGPPGNAAPTSPAVYTTSLAAFAGDRVRIRWLLGVDFDFEFEGFRLDDVSIAPLAATAAPGLGNVLRAVATPAGSHFTWSDFPGIPWYRLRASVARDLSGSTLVGEGPGGVPGIDDLDPRPAAVTYYHLHTAPACGIEGP